MIMFSQEGWFDQRLAVGTHFLWHSFSAVGAYFILDYLYMTTRPLIKAEQNGQIPA